MLLPLLPTAERYDKESIVYLQYFVYSILILRQKDLFVLFQNIKFIINYKDKKISYEDRQSSIDKFEEKYLDTKFLIVKNIDQIVNKEATQKKLMEILFKFNIKAIFSSNIDIKEIETNAIRQQDSQKK